MTLSRSIVAPRGDRLPGIAVSALAFAPAHPTAAAISSASSRLELVLAIAFARANPVFDTIVIETPAIGLRAIRSNESLTLRDTTVRYNESWSDGGGIRNDGGAIVNTGILGADVAGTLHLRNVTIAVCFR